MVAPVYQSTQKHLSHTLKIGEKKPIGIKCVLEKYDKGNMPTF